MLILLSVLFMLSNELIKDRNDSAHQAKKYDQGREAFAHFENDAWWWPKELNFLNVGVSL